MKSCDTFTIPRRAQAAGRTNLTKKVVFRGLIVNLPWRNRRALPMSEKGRVTRKRRLRIGGAQLCE
jgi:hypothetical protein